MLPGCRGAVNSPARLQLRAAIFLTRKSSLQPVPDLPLNNRGQPGTAMQVLVVGAGVVGLAVARAAALAGHEVIVAEAAHMIGTGTSSRNSEVIHAGLYYPTGSKRAWHCTRSRRMLYDFCASHGVPYRKCGKLVVATNDNEVARLDGVLKQAQANGVEGVDLIEATVAKRLEPELAC